MNKEIIGTPISKCFYCRNWIKNVYPLVCRAFVEGIPNEILLSKHNHTKPYPNDNGIRFEPINKQDKPKNG